MSSCTFEAASAVDPPEYQRGVEVHVAMIVTSPAIDLHTDEVVVEMLVRRSAWKWKAVCPVSSRIVCSASVDCGLVSCHDASCNVPPDTDWVLAFASSCVQ
jgi:hypothetical protein